MKDNIKFHIVSSILNASIIGVLMIVHGLIAEKIDYLFSIRIPVYFDLIYLISAFIISWVAPFMIYKIKNYKKHFFALLIFYWILILFFLIFEYINNLEYTDAYNGNLGYLKHCFTTVLIEEYVILISILLSVIIYCCQFLIGRVFIPVLYTEEDIRGNKGNGIIK
ncbi:hypothetical protein [Aquimarina muelleri]|uniref:Uncharacterized protein n=1 Tax=Aquimarina muelleri TaxID=279356 RepID=A0A918N3K7_9FLAO|nr:hypothetical protein [Aquimarina muelleri]MCX2763591.1 hypothetical protein [Aquimarina muelleri]GGX14619.1 hypothetical protein GCM10007384_15270 [Aquimarina muelleri]